MAGPPRRCGSWAGPRRRRRSGDRVARTSVGPLSRGTQMRYAGPGSAARYCGDGRPGGPGGRRREPVRRPRRRAGRRCAAGSTPPGRGAAGSSWWAARPASARPARSRRRVRAAPGRRLGPGGGRPRRPSAVAVAAGAAGPPEVAAAVAEALAEVDLLRERAADPEAARFRFVAAATEALLQSAEPDGLVVVLEDLHWADDTSLRLLRHLAGELHRSRLLVVGTYRDPGGDGRRPPRPHPPRPPALARHPGAPPAPADRGRRPELPGRTRPAPRSSRTTSARSTAAPAATRCTCGRSPG